jgi:hypothetical protein
MSQSNLATAENELAATPPAQGATPPLGTHQPHVGDDDAPRLEPWLVVSLLAIVPMIVAFAIPKAFVLYTAAISGILLVVGLAMLVVQERRRRP